LSLEVFILFHGLHGLFLEKLIVFFDGGVPGFILLNLSVLFLDYFIELDCLCAEPGQLLLQPTDFIVLRDSSCRLLRLLLILN
jgi:hypothetical protein